MIKYFELISIDLEEEEDVESLVVADFLTNILIGILKLSAILTNVTCGGILICCSSFKVNLLKLVLVSIWIVFGCRLVGLVFFFWRLDSSTPLINPTFKNYYNIIKLYLVLLKDKLVLILLDNPIYIKKSIQSTIYK